MLMPSTPQPQLHNALGNLLDDEDDYVMIDGPSPFNSTHGFLCAPGLLTAILMNARTHAVMCHWITLSLSLLPLTPISILSHLLHTVLKYSLAAWALEQIIVRLCACMDAINFICVQATAQLGRIRAGLPGSRPQHAWQHPASAQGLPHAHACHQQPPAAELPLGAGPVFLSLLCPAGAVHPQAPIIHAETSLLIMDAHSLGEQR